jgi:hypothetical protein
MRPLFLLLLTLFVSAAAGAETTELVAGSASRLVLLGSSNVTDWRCSGTTLDGRMDVAGDEIIDGIEAFHLRVPVRSLRCGNRQMERDLYRALRSDQNPVIDFQFEELAGAVERDPHRDRYRATITGALSLAGTRRSVKIPVEAVRIAGGRFLLRARLPLRMTDFRITPPTALFGMVKAHDDLVVQFDLVLQLPESRS